MEIKLLLSHRENKLTECDGLLEIRPLVANFFTRNLTKHKHLFLSDGDHLNLSSGKKIVDALKSPPPSPSYFSLKCIKFVFFYILFIYFLF